MNRFVIVLLFILCNGLFATTNIKADFADNEAIEIRIKEKKIALEVLAQLPVLDEGRVKPFDTWARIKLLEISGKSSYKKITATEMMADIMWNSLKVDSLKLFLINHPDVATSLSLKSDGRERFSYDEISPKISSLNKAADKIIQFEEAERSLVDREMLRIAQSIHLYQKIKNGFLVFKPSPEFAIKNVNIQEYLLLHKNWLGKQLSFYELDQVINGVKFKSNGEENSLADSLAIQELSRLNNDIDVWRNYYGEGEPKWIPISKSLLNTWANPLELVLNGFSQNKQLKKSIDIWQELAVAWKTMQWSQFTLHCQHWQAQLDQMQLDASYGLEYDKDLLAKEYLYHKMDFLYKAKLAYGLAFLFMFLVFLLKSKWWVRFAIFTLLAGFVCNVLAIILRMQITGRPPVTNLFETFVFTAATGVLISFIACKKVPYKVSLFIGSSMGFIFLLLSGRYSASGDTMGVLVAVLDSNFWLAVHVITITLGYGGCMFAGLAAHLFLIHSSRKPSEKQQASKNSSYRIMMGALGFGLVFSFIGTVLGGVWADQSWGRFWGWDPKENGALMIVLWTCFLYHAFLAKWISKVGMAAGTAFGMLVVLFAWLGVNMLGVGLHSYGFDKGVATGLLIYFGLELLFIFCTSIISIKRGLKF